MALGPGRERAGNARRPLALWNHKGNITSPLFPYVLSLRPTFHSLRAMWMFHSWDKWWNPP